MSDKIGLAIILAVIILSTALSAAFSPKGSSACGSPVSVVSVTGPIPPFNPGGPEVDVALKDVSGSPVTTIKAILYIPSNVASDGYEFTFGVSSSKPLMPGQTIQASRVLIGAGFDSSRNYTLAINTMIQTGVVYDYTCQARIVAPSW